MDQQLTCSDTEALKIIINELNGMIFLYPHCGQSDATVQVIAPAYLEACVKAKMNRKDFADACSYARQNYTVFPTVAHIIKAHRDLMAGARVPHTKPSLPPVITDEMRDRGVANCRKILDMVKNVKRVPKCRTFATR
ncbi:hypothetical protein [Desulfovibrio sp. UCD-KL4C]|uniref:hypothetical protein n=1 Tax=Desulfovibrio sp. UCD-KL4C TaxID=2578120 RepID=UPI0025BDA9D8|nr:hypothetical protein [Desulfovibrio sp. UCD-KL4C]